MAHQLYRRGSAASSAGLTGPSPPFQTSGTAMIMPPGEPDREQEDTPAVTISHHVPLQPSYQFWVSPPSEMEALSFFFQNVVRFSEKSEDSASGWLGELRGLHKETLPGSHLDNATVALSWINLGTATKRKDAIENARIAYGKALRNTREALNDPIQRRTDETLVAALVLGYFEVRRAQDRADLPERCHSHAGLSLSYPRLKEGMIATTTAAFCPICSRSEARSSSRSPALVSSSSTSRTK